MTTSASSGGSSKFIKFRHSPFLDSSSLKSGRFLNFFKKIENKNISFNLILPYF
jgi:hypothetical protein